MTRGIDLQLRPQETAYVATLLRPEVLHVYESSVDGMTTIVLRDSTDTRHITAGTRLTRGQVEVLADELNRYLHGETLGEAYNRGREVGYESGFEHGHDLGYELGFDRGRCEVDW